MNTGGSPVNGLYDFRFRLDADPQGNTILATLLTNAIPVTNGLFTATIDFGAGWFNGSNYWLELDVKTNNFASYTALNPLQQITPAPYSVFATTASNVSGTVSAAQISGAMASANLSGTYGNALTLNNAENSFNGSYAGNGAAVTNVNAATVNGLGAANFWQLGGNNVSTGQFLGSTNNQPVEFGVNGGRALRLEPGTSGQGAPNVIGGSPNNLVASGVVGATIGGGGATNFFGSSFTNSVTANFGTVAGGFLNVAAGYVGTVSGGSGNVITNEGAAIGGGEDNFAGGEGATIVGGWNNINNAYLGAIPGGRYNLATGQYSFAAGLRAQATNDGAFVWADSQNTVFGSTKPNQFNVRANGGVRFVTSGAGMTVDGQNVLTGTSPGNAGGLTNLNAAQLNGSVPSGVSVPSADLTGSLPAISGASLTSLSAGNLTGTLPAISGANLTSLNASQLSSGTIPLAQLPASVITNNESGAITLNGTITASSLSVTNQLRLNDKPLYFRTGGDINHGMAYSGTTVTNFGTGNVQVDGPVLWGFSGGALAVMNGGAHAVLTWTNGGVSVTGGFAFSSDRNMKTGFAALDAQEVLARVATLPMGSWYYKTDTGARHVGPMAQDFHATFALGGDDDRHINVGDEGGVALAAIQGLNQKLEQKEAEITELKTRLEKLEQLMSTKNGEAK